MASVASKSIEEVTAHAQSDSLEDARQICADGTYFPNNLRTIIFVYSNTQKCLRKMFEREFEEVGKKRVIMIWQTNKSERKR